VPNNSAFVLRFLAELAAITGDDGYLAPGGGLLTFLEHAQKPTGEFPYSLEYSSSRDLWAHFQCYQYNAFQCLDLIRFFEITGHPQARRILDQVLVFLQGGMAPDGHAYYQCGNHFRAVTYHSAVLAAAFWKASQLGETGFEEWADRGFAYVLNQQLPNGGFHYSHGDYRLLQDHRSYPRYLAMILFHLLLREPEPAPAVAPEQSQIKEN
jgi:hypothetical protein